MGNSVDKRACIDDIPFGLHLLTSGAKLIRQVSGLHDGPVSGLHRRKPVVSLTWYPDRSCVGRDASGVPRLAAAEAAAVGPGCWFYGPCSSAGSSDTGDRSQSIPLFATAFLAGTSRNGILQRILLSAEPSVFIRSIYLQDGRMVTGN